MNKVIDKAKNMPKLILHNWNFDEELLNDLHKLGYYNDTLLPKDFPEDTDLLDCTALATIGMYWGMWEYDAEPNESDPGVMNFCEDEFIQDGSKESQYWKDYFDCGTNKELFLKLAKYKIPEQ